MTKFQMTLAGVIHNGKVMFQTDKLTAQLDGWVGRQLAKLFEWALSYNEVQRTIAREIRCGSPLGDFFNRAIDSAIDNFDIDDKVGPAIDDALDSRDYESEISKVVESTIEDYDFSDAVENALDNTDIDAKVEQAVSNYVEGSGGDEIVAEVFKALVRKLSEK